MIFTVPTTALFLSLYGIFRESNFLNILKDNYPRGTTWLSTALICVLYKLRYNLKRCPLEKRELPSGTFVLSKTRAISPFAGFDNNSIDTYQQLISIFCIQWYRICFIFDDGGKSRIISTRCGIFVSCEIWHIKFGLVLSPPQAVGGILCNYNKY